MAVYMGVGSNIQEMISFFFVSVQYIVMVISKFWRELYLIISGENIPSYYISYACILDYTYSYSESGMSIRAFYRKLNSQLRTQYGIPIVQLCHFIFYINCPFHSMQENVCYEILKNTLGITCSYH